MNSIQETELTLISALHPIIRPKVISTVLKCLDEGLQVGVQCGFRSFSEQSILYAKGRGLNGVILDKNAIVTNASPGLSFHNYALAVDIVFKDSKGNWTWDIPFSEWQKMGEIGKSFGMEWGGDWKFQDLPHLQYTNGLSSIHVAKELYDKGGIDLVWASVI